MEGTKFSMDSNLLVNFHKKMPKNLLNLQISFARGFKASQANAVLQTKTERKPPKHDVEVKWKYCSPSSFTSGQRYYKAGKTHFNNDGLNDIMNLIKRKILYSKYKKKLNNAGNSKASTSETNNCRCPNVFGEINPTTFNSPNVSSGTINELTLNSPPICALVFRKHPQLPPDKSKPSVLDLIALVGYKT